MAKDLNVKQLRMELKTRGLNATGKKAELLERLVCNLMEEDEISEVVMGNRTRGYVEERRNRTRSHVDLQTEPEIDLTQMDQENRSQRTRCDATRFTIRDIIDILPWFDPTDDSGLTSEQWVHHVETLMDIHQIEQRVIILAAKEKMKAYAKKWYELNESDISWTMFAKELKRSFKSNRSQAEVHEMLKRKIRNKEQNLVDYFYDMCAVAKKYVKEEDIIYYIIQGMNEYKLSAALKTIRIKSIEELKEQIEWYVKMNKEPEYKERKIDGVKKTDVYRNPKVGETKEMRRNQCYNCFEDGHIASKCPKPLRKPTCERCKKIGHKKEQCYVKLNSTETNQKLYKLSNSEDEETETKVETNTIEVDESSQITAKVMVGNRLMSTKLLIDSGSHVSIVKESFIKGSVYNSNKNDLSNITGINDSSLKILGNYESNVIINDKIYKVDLLVVTNETMDINIILGWNFLKKNSINTVKIGPLSAFSLDLMQEVALLDDRLMLIDSRLDLSIGDTVETVRYRNTILDIYRIYYLEGKIFNNKIRYEAEINLKETGTIRANPKRFSYYEAEELKRITDELLQTGVIRPSESSHTSRVVLVKKKDGTLRMCINYRQLNKLVERIYYPMPVIEDVLVRLNGKKYFSSVDLRNGFYHVDLAESSKKYTSFVTQEGQFEYNKFPSGYTNSPAHFVKYIQLILKEFTDSHKILIFIDDILVATEGIEEHLEILKDLFIVLAGNNVKLQVAKCKFLKTEIEYLGYNIKQFQITLSDKHIETIKNYPLPTDNKSLQRFIGLTSYFRKFIENFTKIAIPLYDLLKVQEFKIGGKHVEAFNKLKGLLVNRPVLGIYSINNETQLHTDASSSGYGAVLMQRQREDKEFHPVMYFSRKTTDTEAKLHSFELETLAVVYAIKRFRPYLFGLHFTIITDCNALKLALKKRDLNPKIDRWALYLEGYDFEVIHRGGNRMRHVDALSRMQIYYLEMDAKDLFLEKIYICQIEDSNIQKIKLNIVKGTLKGYELREGIVYKKDKKRLQLLIPERMVESVIWKYHDNMGHLGYGKVSELIRRQFYFPKMTERLKQHVEGCIVCVAYNPKPVRKEVLLKNIEKDNEPFQTIHIDHLGPLEITKRKNVHILLVIDAFTKFVKLYATKTTNTAEVCKHLKSYFQAYSIPKRIITDRGTAYTSQQFEKFMKDQGIIHVKIATSSPNSNGQIERYNRVVVPILAKMVNERGEEWDKLLTDVEYLLNNTWNKAINEIPA